LVILGDKNGGLNEEDHIQIRYLKNVSSVLNVCLNLLAGVE
jgi:hypothetical protein